MTSDPGAEATSASSAGRCRSSSAAPLKLGTTTLTPPSGVIERPPLTA